MPGRVSFRVVGPALRFSGANRSPESRLGSRRRPNAESLNPESETPPKFPRAIALNPSKRYHIRKTELATTNPPARPPALTNYVLY